MGDLDALEEDDFNQDDMQGDQNDEKALVRNIISYGVKEQPSFEVQRETLA